MQCQQMNQFVHWNEDRMRIGRGPRTSHNKGERETHLECPQRGESSSGCGSGEHGDGSDVKGYLQVGEVGSLSASGDDE